MWRLASRPVDLDHSKSIVLLGLDGKLGDAILQSSIVHAVHRAHSECEIDIVTTPNVSDYWRECDGINAVHVVDTRRNSLYGRLRDLRRLANNSRLAVADVIIALDPIPMIDYFALIHWCRPKIAIALSATQYKLFQISITDPIFEIPKRHVAERYVRILAALGIATNLDNLVSLVPRTVSFPKVSGGTESQTPNRTLFINGYGASPTRTFTVEQVEYVAKSFLALSPLNCVIINPSDIQRLSAPMARLGQFYSDRVSFFPADASIITLFELIAKSTVVLTPDTGISHIAAATRIPAVIAYDDVDFNPVCWRPLSPLVLGLVPSVPGPISQISGPSLMMALEKLMLTQEPG